MLIDLPDCGAVISDDGVYRYWLGRIVPNASLVSVLATNVPRRVLFVCLNPSTADSTKDDPTIRRLLGYARAWDFARVDVVNLFGFRSASPAVLAKAHVTGVDIIGPENDAYLKAAAQRASKVIVAWGGRVPTKLKKTRPIQVLRVLTEVGAQLGWTPEYLELANDGTPKHPLYLKGSLVPQPLSIPLTTVE